MMKNNQAMMKSVSRIREFLTTDTGVLIVLGLVSLVAFAIFIPFSGFYWDDWIWKFFSYAYESDYLLWQPVDRPLAGTLHVLLDAVLGDNPLNWQLANLFFRWANAAGYYWMLKKVFPNPKTTMAVVAAFFLIYPGFSEQWISIAFIHHLVPMTLLWVSFVLMFEALETQARRRRSIKFGSSVILAALVMLTTEYFFGIEIFRVVLLFYYLWRRSPGEKPSGTLWETIRVWWPFAVVSLGLVLWRSAVGVSEGASYSVDIPGMFNEGLAVGLLDFLKNIGIGIYSATVQAMINSFSLPEITTFGQSKTILFYVVFLGVFAAGTVYFLYMLDRKEDQDNKVGIALILLGLIGLVLGGQPFWVAGMQYLPKFPEDRLGLPLMVGESMVFVGIVLLLVRHRQIRALILAAIFVFGVGSNFQTGAAFTQSWKEQQVFWRQFVTRVPSLEPGTVLVTKRLPPAFMNDLSFMMTLNWLYDLDLSEEELQYGLFYGDSRGVFQTIEDEMPVVYNHRKVVFRSDIDQTLAFFYGRNDCLTFFDGEDGFLIPSSRHLNPEIFKYSDMGQIDLTQDRFGNWPAFFDEFSEETWCDYYLKADLELQRENYVEVARLGDMAFPFSPGETPKRPWELTPFIEGYAFVGRWNEAVGLTEEVISASQKSEALLCKIWNRISEDTDESETKQKSLDQVAGMINCD
jgi:hypothetical protein